MTASLPKLVLQNVKKTFTVKDPNQRGAKPQRFTALEDVSLQVGSGEFMVLVGPSGCGKSTLLDLLGGLTQPDAGQILLDGKPIRGPGQDRGIVFQQYALFPWRTAAGNVEFGLEANGVPLQERKDRSRHFLSLVGLSGFENRFPHELSGGMKQRVAIARALAFNPDVLMMDEPFAALDAQTRELLQNELVRIWQETKKTIIFITHGIDEAVFLGQRVAIMTSRPGRIKTVLTLPETLRERDRDVRALPEFGQARHEIWSLLSDEVQRAQEQERRRKLGEGSIREQAHG